MVGTVAGYGKPTAISQASLFGGPDLANGSGNGKREKDWINI